MKNILLFCFMLFSITCNAEQNIKIYHEKIEGGYSIYADNMEFCPVSIKIDFTLTNLTLNEDNKSIYVLAPNKDRQLLTTLKVEDVKKAYQFSFTTLYNYGDHHVEDYDKEYVYDLPFKTSTSFNVYQGYNGTFSHQNENSLDFTMPVGTEIMAVREGVVIKVIEENNRNCAKEKCKKYNNLIMVYHSDGTFAEYVHIKKNGSKVKVGDQVAKGELIGYSGNVGWSTGPHLHLVIFKQKLNGRETLKTKFKIEDGNTIEYLKEKRTYSRLY